jgi:hypothetical protein
LRPEEALVLAFLQRRLSERTGTSRLSLCD